MLTLRTFAHELGTDALLFACVVILAPSCSRPPGESVPAPAPTQVKPRRSLAVLGFRNLSGRPDAAWLSGALAEMLGRELAASEELRMIPDENVARMKVDLAVPDIDSLPADMLSRIRSNLGTDLVILGSYTAEAGGAGRKIHLDLFMQDARSGGTVARVADTGSETGLRDFVSRLATRLHQDLHGSHPEPTLAGPAVASSTAVNPEAARLRAEGLASLRSFDPTSAQKLLERAVAADPSSPQAHAAMAAAWSGLGYDLKAKEEIKRASDLSANLPREERLFIEGRYHEAFKAWEKAIEAYRTLVGLFPDNVEYGLRLAEVLSAAGRGKEALLTVEVLRKLPPPGCDDPRIDLAEATAAHSLSDYRKSQEAAASAVVKGSNSGARLLVAQARYQEGRAAARAGDPGKAIAACDIAKRTFAEIGDRAGMARSLNLLANIASDQGDLARAKAAYEEALATYRVLGNRAGTAAALNNLAVVSEQRGDMAGALEMYQQSLGIFREVGDKRSTAVNLNNIGEIMEQQGDLISAKRMFEQSLEIRRGTGDKWGIAGSLNNIAKVLRVGGDLPGAERAYQEALTIAREIGSKSRQGATLDGLGRLCAARGDFGGARKRYDESVAIRSGIGEKGGIAETWLAIASLAICQVNAGAAESLAREALAEFENEKRPDDKAYACAVLADALLAQSKSAAAQESIDQALKLSNKSRNLDLRLTVAISAARVRAAAGRHAEASMRIEDAMATARKAGLVSLQLEARLLLGEIEIQSGKAALGRQHLQALANDASKLGFVSIAHRAAGALS